MEQLADITGYESIPEEMKNYPNWVVWKREVVKNPDGTIKVDENGEIKYTKIPYKPKTNLKASTTNPTTWTDFDTAVACETNYDGLGFVFTNTPFAGVDLDKVKDAIMAFENYDETNIVCEFYNQLKTYAEVSPSGNGVHFIIKGELPEGNRKIGNIEMYDDKRFFTVTGDQLGEYDDINLKGTELIKPLHAKYLGQSDTNIATFKDFEAIPSYGNGLSEDEVILALNRDRQKTKWMGLFFNGNWQAYGYSSRSDAELALIGKLGFYSNYDKEVMDSIFKQSRLYEEKWERTKVYTLGRVIPNRPKDGGYKSKKEFTLNIQEKPKDMKLLKQNTEPPGLDEFEKKQTFVLPDKNGVLWYLHTFAGDRDPEVRLVKKYYNYENMAKVVTNMVYNEFSEVVEYSNEGSHELVDDPYISEMYRKISQLYIDVPQKDLYHIVNNLGRKFSYHPIKQLIESVEWDRSERIETFFIDYFGLEDTSYHREVSRKWFVGAVARIYSPGIKFDMVPIIRGAQGVGKTTAIEKLAFELDYYLSLNSEKVNDKDTMQLLRDSWIVELEELEFIKSNTDGAIKKFFTVRDDKYREPYGKNQRNYKRHSVFIGTVNDKSFLKDKTGNRRYYPLVIEDGANNTLSPIHDLNTDIVHQIWAEALVNWKEIEKVTNDRKRIELMTCSAESEKAFEIIRGNSMEEDVTEQTLLEFLDLDLPQEYYIARLEDKRLYLSGAGGHSWNSNPALRPDITTREILAECFGREIDADWRGDQSSKRINTIMENLPDWTKSNNVRRTGVDGVTRTSRGFKRKD